MPSTPTETSRSGTQALDQRELKKFPGYLLARARFVAFRAFEQAVRESCNLRPVEFSVLLLLAHNPEATQTQLSQALGVAPPNMTGILRRLEERKLLARARAASDGRQQFISLTPAGERLVADAQAQAKAADKAWMNRLSRAEQAMLMELLDRLSRPSAIPVE